MAACNIQLKLTRKAPRLIIVVYNPKFEVVYNPKFDFPYNLER